MTLGTNILISYAQIWENVYPIISILRKLTATEHQLQVTFVSKDIKICMYTYILFYKQPPPKLIESETADARTQH